MRSPLVYASTLAREQARALLPQGAIVENEVQAAIARGDIVANNHAGVVFVDRLGVVAHVRRARSRTRTGKKCWLVRSVEPEKLDGRRSHLRVGASSSA